MNLMFTKIFAALLTLFVGVSAKAATNVVKVDHAHMQIGENASSKLSYSIGASPEIILDLAEYKFSLWPENEPAPNTVSVVITDNQQYYLKLQTGKTKYLLSPSTLVPRPGALPFRGFASGQKFMLAIGRLRLDREKQEEILRVHWLGQVDVK